MESLEQKLEELKAFIADKGKNGVVIAFSGGVDSVTLAAVCHQVLGPKVIAIIAQSPTYTPKDLRNAQQLAKDIAIDLYVVHTHELENEDFRRNPMDRCYHCKKEFLQKLLKFGSSTWLLSSF
jgi:uncharacterized protein